MERRSVVEGFDVIEEHEFSLLFGLGDGRAEAFGFKSGPKGFHHGVVVAVGFTAHGVGCSATIK